MANCSRTGKVKFNKVDAGIALSDIQFSNTRPGRRRYRDQPTRSYECEFCRSWHLTSQPKKSAA